MSQSPPQHGPAVEWYLSNPFKAVWIGLALGCLAMLPRALAALKVVEGEFFLVLRVVMLVASLVAAGAAVWWRLSTADANDFEEQSKTGILLALASGCVLTAYVALPPNCDTLQLFLLVLWVVTLVFVPVLLLPSIARRIVVSGLVLFHFGGILTATTAVQLPNNAPLPWLPTTVWNHVYRNYLTFAYLNNAYHFYSPEPGPPTLVWFQVVFEDGTKHGKTYWKRVVRREDYPTRQQYQRMLSLTENVNQPTMVPPSKFVILTNRRNVMASQFSPFKDDKGNSVRFAVPTEIPIQDQYREPGDLAKKYIKSYAAHVCSTTKHPDFPDLKVRSVRIYRLTHMLINAGQLASVNGLSPTDPTLFWAYYYGEYKYFPEHKNPKDAVVLQGSPYEEQSEWMNWTETNWMGAPEPKREKVQDPLLYWLLPIYRELKPGRDVSNNLADYNLIDSVSLHSRDKIKWD